MCSQIELLLRGITAEDYLTWIRDPDPPSLDQELVSIAAGAQPFGDRIHVELCRRGPAPDPRTAATRAGFPLTPEVVDVRRAVRRWPGAPRPAISPAISLMPPGAERAIVPTGNHHSTQIGDRYAPRHPRGDREGTS
jgi:hypothetical protein